MHRQTGKRIEVHKRKERASMKKDHHDFLVVSAIKDKQKGCLQVVHTAFQVSSFNVTNY